MAMRSEAKKLQFNFNFQSSHYVIKNSDNQHTFMSHSEIAFSSARHSMDIVKQCQTNLMNMFDSVVSLFVTMFYAERQYLLCDDI